ncbi:MAG: ATP-binding protein [Lachnospiraceae bacterium]|nr:ATP-binding protein [Lachnospiraceae bacterium]
MTGKSDSITPRLFRSTMFTMLAAELSGAVAAVIDGILTGSFLGPVSLAAFGVGTPYFSIACIVSGILTVGCSSLCTRAVGKGDIEETSRVFSLTVFLGAAMSLVLAAGGTIFAGSLSSLFGAGASGSELHRLTADYLRGVFPGAPAFILFVILTPVLQIDGDYSRPRIASLIMSVADIAGDLLNIFVFKGGMLGMGLATSAGHYIALFVLLTHFFKKSTLFRFSFRLLRFRNTFALMRDGLPRALCMLCRGLLPILLNNLAMTLAGNEGVAAYSTLTSISFTVGALGWGIGGAVLVMGGLAAGEQNRHEMKVTVISALKNILFGVVPIAVAVFAAAPLISSMFNPDPGNVRDMATMAIRCYGIALPFLAFNVSAANHLQNISRMKGSYAVNICIEFAATALMALILHGFMGINGIWAAFPAGQALLSLSIVAVSFILRKKGQKGQKGFEAWLMLKKDFGVPEEDCINRSVSTMDEVASLSSDIVEFCTERGFGRKEANRLSLCIEEMAGNVIEHGFSDGKNHHLDIRVYAKDGKLGLRLRDDCPRFDFKKKAEDWTFDPEHPEHNIGIRLAMKAASDISYTNTMKTNNLIVVI